MKRIRVIQYEVRPVAVIDDGETLTPLDVQPIIVPAAEFDTFPYDLAVRMAEHEMELNAKQPEQPELTVVPEPGTGD